MLQADHHVYLILTKRPHRMERFIADNDLQVPQHIWLGTSVENQTFADNRIPPLTRIDGNETIKFISAEPLLGPVDVSAWLNAELIDWVVVGGESGHGRRPMDKDWARDLREQCAQSHVDFFYKQGNHIYPGRDRELDGETHNEFPMAVIG